VGDGTGVLVGVAEDPSTFVGVGIAVGVVSGATVGVGVEVGVSFGTVSAWVGAGVLVGVGESCSSACIGDTMTNKKNTIPNKSFILFIIHTFSMTLTTIFIIIVVINFFVR
jgi:hypothetical protein